MTSNIGNVANTLPLGYTGSQVPVNYINRTTDPTTTDWRFTVPTIWINTSSKRAFILVSTATNPSTGMREATWDILQSSSDLNSITLPDSTVVVPINNNVTFSQSGGITITGNSLTGTVDFNVSAFGISWASVSAATQSMTQDSGYIAARSGTLPADQIVFTLPATAAQFTTVVVVGDGTAGWRIAQNAGQQIKFGPSSTTLGTAGYLQANNAADFVELLCITANTTWRVVSSQGNLTVV